MKKIMMGAFAGLLLATAGCSQTDKDTALGAGAGGLIGAGVGGIVDGGRGALIGGALGAGTGAIIGNASGRSRNGDCSYYDSRTRERYIAPCR